MLGKLINQEIKASARFLLPTYLVLICISILNRFILNLKLNSGLLQIIPTFLLLTYVIAIFTVLVTSFVLMISRFYKNFLTDEGYLMFTLPVTTRDLILSKMIVTFCYTLISVLTTILSLLIVFATPYRLELLHEIILDAYEEILLLNTNIPLVIFLGIVFIITTLILNILNIYASIALGQLYSKHKLLGSFIAYMVIYAAFQAIGLFVVVIVSITNVNVDFTPAHFYYVVTVVTILSSILLSIVFYNITSYMFRRKLNLD